MLSWLSVWSKMQMTCYCHPIVSASVKSRTVILLVLAYPGCSGEKVVLCCIFYHSCWDQCRTESVSSVIMCLCVVRSQWSVYVVCSSPRCSCMASSMHCLSTTSLGLLCHRACSVRGCSLMGSCSSTSCSSRPLRPPHFANSVMTAYVTLLTLCMAPRRSQWCKSGPNLLSEWILYEATKPGIGLHFCLLYTSDAADE